MLSAVKSVRAQRKYNSQEKFNKEPQLVFVAKTTIEVKDELLFDYNDNKSKLLFLWNSRQHLPPPTTSSSRRHRHAHTEPRVNFRN